MQLSTINIRKWFIWQNNCLNRWQFRLKKKLSSIVKMIFAWKRNSWGCCSLPYVPRLQRIYLSDCLKMFSKHDQPSLRKSFYLQLPPSVRSWQADCNRCLWLYPQGRTEQTRWKLASNSQAEKWTRAQSERTPSHQTSSPLEKATWTWACKFRDNFNEKHFFWQLNINEKNAK